MQSFLCRVMALVFLFNCMLPAPGAWAQPRVSSDQIRQLVNQSVTEQLEEQLESSVAAASEELQYAQTPAEIATAISKLHSAVEVRAAFNKQEEAKQKLRESLVAPRSSTYVAPPFNPYKDYKSFNQNEVLQKLAKDELTVDDMINYIDPFEPADYDLQNLIYASEVLGNSIDAVLVQPDELVISQMNGLILFAQLRVLYRLEKLSKKAPASIYDAMALGSLRITLWKLHNFYVQTGQKDPLLAPEIGDPLSNSSFPAPQFNDELPWIATNSWAQREIPFQLPPDIYQQINHQFLTELSTIKSHNPKEGSAEYQVMLSLADYATVYAMLEDPSQITPLVKLFDEGAKRSLISGKVVPGKFQQPYSPVLNDIFTSVYESVKYLVSDSAVWSQIIFMLKDFSDPAQYSLPTNIFALEAASLMYSQSQNCQAAAGAAAADYPVFLRCNSGNMQNDTLRPLFARRTADLYAPLTRTHYLAMKDYGLDSQQMQMLADKLAFIYNGFANDDLKWDYSRPRMKGSYVLDKGEDGKSLILNDTNSIPRLLPTDGGGHQFQLPDGSLKTISGFARTSDGTWVEMQLKNGLNAKKASDEANAKFFWFVGNAIFWIYGGEVLTFIGTAYRTTKGAMLALPKALKTAAQANKGRRALSFGVEIQKGVRFANLAKTLNKNAVTLQVERITEKTVKGSQKRMPAPQSYTPAMESTFKTITTHQALKGKYSKWNPKRWVGKEPAPITRFSFEQPIPGFGGVRQGTVEVTGTSLDKGVRSWDDWRKLRSSFRPLDVPPPNTSTEALSTFTRGFRSSADPKAIVFPRFYDYTTRKQMFQELRLTNAITKAAKGGAFNAWVPIKTPVFEGTAGTASGETVTWWNVTRLGAPGNELAAGFNHIVLTPAIGGKAARITSIDPTKLKNAIEIPLQRVTSNTWQPTVIHHYFNEVERTGIGKYLLPKYVPNANYWQTAKSNWRFALPVLKNTASNTRFWQGLVGNMVFFGAWAGLDMVTYPPMQGWIMSAAKEDQEKAMAKFGDAFDPEKLKEDVQRQEEQAQQAGVDASQNASLSTYQDVSAAVKQSSEGALLTFPIIGVRHALPEGFGNLSFVTEQDEAKLAQMASQLQLNRALVKQAQAQQEKFAQAEKEMKEEYLQMILATVEIDQASYEDYASRYGGENYKKDITAIFNEYKKRITQTMNSDEPLETVNNKLNTIQQDIQNKLTQKIEEIARMIELLQQQAVEEEEYLPYGDDGGTEGYFEETPVEAY